VTGAVDGTLTGAGGVSLFWRRLAPDGTPRGVVVVVHGYAEHLERYADLFAHLVARGLAVAAVDLRGHGRSGGPRGHCGHADELVADVDALVRATGAVWPDVPRLLFAHSMGGLVALRYLVRHPTGVRAAALSAPALRVPDAGSPVVRRVARALGRLAPQLSFTTRLDADGLSRDPAVGPAYVADPLVHRRASAGLVRAIEDAQAAAFADAASVAVPLLVLQGDADRLVDPAAAGELAARLTCPHELVMLPGYYHELLNEPKPAAARVLELLDAWFDRWLGAA